MSVRATGRSITWWVEVGEPFVSAVTNGIYSLYPQAQIDVVPKSGIDKGFYVFYVESIAPYFAPILTVFVNRKEERLIIEKRDVVR